MTPKKIHRHTLLGQQGIVLIERVVLDMGFLWYPTGGIEAGIDGLIELRDPTSGVVLNSIIQVQSKATAEQFIAETADSFEYVCKESDLNYWLQGNAPVILVVSRPSSNEAYWVSVKDYFHDLSTRQKRKVFFSKARDRFDASCAEKLAKLGIPRDAGVYLAPRPKTEVLYSNLLPVLSFARHIYVADTPYRRRSEVWAEFRRKGVKASGEWVLKGKKLVSFHDLHSPPWCEICDVGTAEGFGSEDWAYADSEDLRRDFAELLNRCLSEKTFRAGLKYHSQLECFYFRATEDLSPRNYTYGSIAKRSTRTVFQAYRSKTNPERIAYYRHSAFSGQFRLLDGSWYLEITPTYFFTWNGQHLHGSYEEMLKGIKRLERNGAVLGQVVMWAALLTRPSTLFSSPYPFLEFGPLLRFRLEHGIEDEEWLGREEEEGAALVRSSADDLFA